MTFENLQINVSADTLDAQAGLRGVASAADSAEDELEDAGRKARQASRSFTILGGSASGLSLAFGSMNSVLAGGLLVSLGTLLTTLAPLTAALGVAATAVAGLAAGFGAVLATPFITELDAIKQTFKEVRPELLAVIEPLGERFLPLVQDGIRALPELADRTIEAFGSLDEFESTLRGFGDLAMRVIPGMAGVLGRLGRDALPLLEELVTFLENNGPAALSAMEGSLAELEPEFRELLDAFIELAPTLLEFGTNVADVVLPALTESLRVLDDVLETINGLDPAFRDLAIAGLVLAPVLTKLSGLLWGASGLIPGLVRLGTLLGTTVTGGVFTGGLLGIIGVRILEAEGIVGGSEDDPSVVREAGQNAPGSPGLIEGVLTAGNLATTGGLERFAEFGAAVTPGIQPQAVEDVFNEAARGTGRRGVAARSNVSQMIIQRLTINANSRAEGRAAADGFSRRLNELRGRGFVDTSRGGP